MSNPYQLLGGEAGVRALADAFYDVMNEMPQAETIRAMHKQNLESIKQKLFEYFSGWMGGPPLYFEKYGKICLDKPHAPYPIGEAERDQWLLCMDKALERINASDEVKAMLKQPMFNMAERMRNRD